MTFQAFQHNVCLMADGIAFNMLKLHFASTKFTGDNLKQAIFEGDNFKLGCSILTGLTAKFYKLYNYTFEARDPLQYYLKLPILHRKEAKFYPTIKRRLEIRESHIVENLTT